MNDKPDNGGTAFPRPIFESQVRGEIIDYGDFGMSLRDYFAAKFLAVLISHEKNLIHSVQSDINKFELAKDAYSLADAMLKARAA